MRVVDSLADICFIDDARHADVVACYGKTYNEANEDDYHFNIFPDHATR